MSTTQITGIQVKDLSLGVGEINATGTPGATTYLRGDAVWATVTASQPDIPQSLLAPIVDEIITAGYSVVLGMRYVIASTKRLTLGLSGRMKIV